MQRVYSHAAAGTTTTSYSAIQHSASPSAVRSNSLCCHRHTHARPALRQAFPAQPPLPLHRFHHLTSPKLKFLYSEACNESYYTMHVALNSVVLSQQAELSTKGGHTPGFCSTECALVCSPLPHTGLFLISAVVHPYSINYAL